MRNTVLFFKRAGAQVKASRGPKFVFELSYHGAVRVAVQVARSHIEEGEQVAVFAQQRVVLVAQAVVHGQVAADLPLVLRVADVVRPASGNGCRWRRRAAGWER